MFQDARRAYCVLLIACLLGPTFQAGETKRDHDVVPEDYFTIGSISTVAASPDGRFIAYTESRWEPPREKRNSDLWVVDTISKKTRRLTFDPASVGSPQWSPDGRHIYFTSNRKRAGEEDPPWDGERQVWRISPEGGEAQAVTRVKDGIGDYELSVDGEALYFTKTDEVIEDDWKDLREKYKDLEYGHGVADFSQIWQLDLENWRSKKLVDDHRVIIDFEVSPDRGKIAMITRPDETLLTNEGWSRIDIYDDKTGEVTTATPDGWRKGHD